MTTNTNILISGAGIAGLTLAYWLQKFGFTPVIIEKRPDLNDEGYMIDFYGSGFDVAEKMNLLESLQARHYPVPKLELVDGHGKTRATLDVEKFRKLLNYRHFNFTRGDLETVLYETVKSSIPIKFSISISNIDVQPDRLRVKLSDGISQDYDLVIGADGIHSKVRTLLWGDESQFEHFLGYYVACGVVENFLGTLDAFYSHLEPKKQALVYSIRGNKLATFFAFKSERLNVKERSQQLATLTQVFGQMGWVVPQLLEATKQSPQFYFDPVSQIKLTSWSKDRVALVGDACQCLTLLAGQGASMAMAGAYLLACELDQTKGDYQTAFPAYQDRLKSEIDHRQVEAQKLARSFVPDNNFSIWLMYLFLKVAFLPGLSSIFLRQIGAKSVIK